MYHKPDNTVTDSIHEYLLAWHAVAEPIAEATNSTFLGCNPGLTFEADNEKFVLPAKIALRLAAALKERPCAD
jgi:hypothetical protein